jgi:hypothetical protein
VSTLAVDQITDNSGGSTTTINGLTPTPSNMMGRNKIINGKMEIAQRGTSFAAAANGAYTLDRFVWNNSTSGVVTVSQQTDVPSSNEFQSSLRVAVTTADTTIVAADQVNISHRLEGYNARDLIGRTFTISFWVRSSKTGIHCVCLNNSGADRSYVAEYTISAANTWEFKTITVSGGLITAGTWNWTNGLGLYVTWILAAGSNVQTTANAWQTGNFAATSSQVNCLDTIGNIFAITGVQLEVGSVATPFEHRPYGAELALCQRYYEVIGGEGQGYPSLQSYGAAGLTYATTIPFQVSKRAAPTMAVVGTWNVLNSGQPTADSATKGGFRMYAVTTALGRCFFETLNSTNYVTASIEL